MTIRDDLQAALGSTHTIERELGGGGMSHVFVGNETALDRKVAIKVLDANLAAGVSAERFQREIKLAAQLQHPNIVPVITTGVAAGLPYYTMPFVDGLSLRNRLERSAGLPVVEAVSILRDTARALAYAHDRGIVHRDIKPDNILLADAAAVVTDFGIAKALYAARTDAPGGTLTQVGTSLGTPAYMSPEQIAGDPSTNHRADIYAFGCVAYETLTGAAPFAHRQPHQLFAAHMGEKVAALLDRRPDCPPGIAALITRCLEKDPANRPQSARELLSALDAERIYTTPVASPSPSRRISRKMILAAVAAVTIVSVMAGRVFLARGAGADVQSLAVLPFENLGGDTANAYFAEGMADELTTELSKIPQLVLAPRTAAFRFRGATVDVKEVGRELQVGAVLEGSVRRAGNRLRLTAQLTNVSNGKLLWTDVYEQQVEDVFALQDSITRAIAEALRVKLTGGNSVSAVATTRDTRNREAYDLYMRGRYLWARRGNESIRKALKLFEQAILADPNFARAHAGFAMAASVLPMYTYMRSDSIVPAGVAAARRAIALDPKLADAHLGLALLLMYDFDWKEAEQHFTTALALDRDNSTAHQWYGDFLYVTGRLSDAIPELERAIALEPHSAVMRNDYGYALGMAGRYTEAEASHQRALELDSTFRFGVVTLGQVLVAQGKMDQAAALGADAEGDNLVAVIGAYRQSNRPAEAASAFRRARSAILKRTYGIDYAMALIHSSAGNPDSAFHWLNRAVDVKDGGLIANSVPCDLSFVPLQSDPRFDALLRRMDVKRCRKGPNN